MQQYQAFEHCPEKGTYGDCHRTSIAMCLGLDRDEVPAPTAESFVSGETFNAFYREWFEKNNISVLSFSVEADSPEKALEILTDICFAYSTKGLPFVFSGTAPRGTDHSVAVINGKVYDPHRSGDGITGPATNTQNAYAALFPIWRRP